jgi:aspartate/methionine/tyrosine aminotransferase
MFDHVSHTPQGDLEEAFHKEFFSCAGQQHARNAKVRRFLSYSSSCAIKIAAQYCRIKGLRVLLLEPCFDNIRHILLTEGVKVQALAESVLCDYVTISTLANSNTAFWIVYPNNPTGFALYREQFEDFVEAATSAGATLIVDFCFRFYMENLATWDQYRILAESKCTFVAIEDTGKTWGVSDIKIGLTVSSEDAGDLLHLLHDQLLLNVSGLQLALLTSLIRDSVVHGLDAVIRKPVEQNRSLIHSLIAPDLFDHASTDCQNVPLEYLRLPRHYDAVRFWQSLRESGVDILPASNYYWSMPGQGADCIRIPLARQQSDVQAAVPILRQALRDR